MKNTILTLTSVSCVVALSATSSFAEGTNCNGCGGDRLTENVSANAPDVGPPGPRGEPGLQENVGDFFKDTKTGEFTLNNAGPIAIGLGAIIAIGATRNSNSATNTTR